MNMKRKRRASGYNSERNMGRDSEGAFSIFLSHIFLSPVFQHRLGHRNRVLTDPLLSPG
jgi:hypothetical protein